MIQINDVHYIYPTKYQKVEALRGISCPFEEGKLYTVIGKSGSGKSTLLSLLSGLVNPSQGNIQIDGALLNQMDRNQYRREKIAMIYQNLNLFPLLTVLENIMYPMRLNKVAKKEAVEKAYQLIEQMELSELYINKLPNMLSGGEQQRVAIARALAMPGKIILADEPTGNLDVHNTVNIVNHLSDLAHKYNYCVIIVTHDTEVAKRADMVYELKDGEIIATGTPNYLML